jgi:hypothetical protein
MNFAHFQNIQHFLVQQLNTAQKSIHVAVAWFTDRILLELLVQKAKNNVEIIVFLTDDHINHNLDFGELIHAGGKVYKTDEQKLMHHKFCIIDEKILCFGSYNWTFKANHYNTENLVITEEIDLIKNFQEEFKRLYKIYNINPNIDVKDITLYYAKNSLWLKTQIRILEVQNAFLTTEIDKISQLITQFNILLGQYVGFALLKLNELKLFLAQKKAKLTQKQEDIKTYFEQKQSFENFSQNFENQKKENISFENFNPKNTTETEDLKVLYRKIAKLSHPDAVEEQHKIQASSIFDLAKKAFDTQDLQKLKEILKDLENGIAFTLDIENTDEIDKLQALFEKLSNNNEKLSQNLQNLHQSPHYQKITKYEDNWEMYFEEVKQGIEKEIQNLNSQ